MPIVFRVLLLSFALFVLAGCDSSEERAEKHFQNGLSLLQDGDAARAFIEFRNALALDESHREARTTYARAARETGNVSAAYANYLRIAEEFPEDMEARLALSEIAIVAQNWDEAERHGAALLQAEPPVEGSEIVGLALAFREAVLADEALAIRELTRQAAALAEISPNNQILVRVLIEGYMEDNRVDDAITVTAGILSADTDNPLFYEVMAELLLLKGDVRGLEDHFRLMLEKFPDDDETKGNLIGLLIAEGRGPQAEAFLRDEIETAEDKVNAHVSLIALIRQLRGDDAALAEIDSAISLYEVAPLLTALKAGLIFDRGDREAAIALMQTVAEGVQPSLEVDNFKVTLAKMLIAVNNEVGGRQLVEEVLEHDPSHVEALKMRATWEIDADQTDEAIETLRLALDQEPNDAEAMTIMARAHERNGATQLSQDLLALAVEASRNAPAESIRFARVQISEERFSSAEDILVNALRRSPGHPELLTMLGRVYVAQSDWGRAEQVVQTLRRLDDPSVTTAADDLQLQIVTQREGREQGVGFLESLVQNGSDRVAATVALIQARLQENRGEDALDLAMQLVEANPSEPSLALVLGNTHLALGNFAKAEAAFQSVVDQDIGNTMAVMQLLRTMNSQSRTDEATALLDTALTASPDDIDLLWAKASFLEQGNDIDGAIEIYETIYAQNTDNQIVANNLASLLVTYRTDEASMERAFAVGRRLRGTDFAPFQDTYGWLQYRQDNHAEALTYLEPAAATLNTDPIVQFHLAKTYLALGRNADALRQFETVVSLADPADPRPQIAEARAEVERLSTASQ
ncbi:MAG: tetratricopeptide repeat protein [Pseudomonadota bacterium]